MYENLQICIEFLQSICVIQQAIRQPCPQAILPDEALTIRFAVQYTLSRLFILYTSHFYQIDWPYLSASEYQDFKLIYNWYLAVNLV